MEEGKGHLGWTLDFDRGWLAVGLNLESASQVLGRRAEKQRVPPDGRGVAEGWMQ